VVTIRVLQSRVAVRRFRSEAKRKETSPKKNTVCSSPGDIENMFPVGGGEGKGVLGKVEMHGWMFLWPKKKQERAGKNLENRSTSQRKNLNGKTRWPPNGKEK